MHITAYDKEDQSCCYPIGQGGGDLKTGFACEYQAESINIVFNHLPTCY